MWFLRAWQIGEIEVIAGGTEKPPIGVDSSEKSEGQQAISSSFEKSSVVKRLFAWKKV